MSEIGSGFTDQQAAVVRLMESGSTHQEALAVVLSDPAGVARLAEQQRAVWNRQEEERAAREYAESEAGRREAAAAALQARVERQALEEAGRALLESEGHDPDAVARMGAEEVLYATGQVERPWQQMGHRERDGKLQQLAEKWGGMPGSERIARAKQLGEDPALVARYAESLKQAPVNLAAVARPMDEGGASE